MNIVYGVSGEGLGHVYEAIEVASFLQQEGHTVKVLTYGDRAVESLKAFNPTRIEGIQLYFKPQGLSLADTLTKNLGCFPFYLRHWHRLRRELEEFRPDAFITAYEPFTTIAAHELRRPLISMDNQNELLYIRPPDEGYGFSFMLAQWATRVCTHGAAHYIVKSFHESEEARSNVHFVAPIIQNEIRRLTPSYGDHVLVYLTKPNPELIEVLKTLDETFFVYCNNREGSDGNVTYRRQGATYVRDLSQCKAIIATTGFSLIADAIYLKKPYFGVPLKRQFEQTHNGHFIRDSGFGECSETVTREALLGFLGRLPLYRESLSRYHLDPAEQERTLLALLSKVCPDPLEGSGRNGLTVV